MGRGRCERASGEVKRGKKNSGQGDVEREGTGKCKKKEAFKDWLRFVVTERDRSQASQGKTGRSGLLATARQQG
jgi:hypothetical protein